MTSKFEVIQKIIGTNKEMLITTINNLNMRIVIDIINLVSIILKIKDQIHNNQLQDYSN